MFNIFWRQSQVRLAASPQAATYRSLISASRLNHIAKISQAQRYLEIGVARGETIEAIDVKYRVGVDPSPLFRVDFLPENLIFFRMNSDDFFYRFTGKPFQLIFIDGLHEAKQAYRDVMNAFKILDERGFILLDDVWPTDYASSLPSIKKSNREKKIAGVSHRRWYGDVFKVLSALNYFYPEINIQVIGNSVESHSQALIWREKTLGSIENLGSVFEYMDSIDYKNIFAQNLSQIPWANWVKDVIFYKDFSKWVKN